MNKLFCILILKEMKTCLPCFSFCSLYPNKQIYHTEITKQNIEKYLYFYFLDWSVFHIYSTIISSGVHLNQGNKLAYFNTYFVWYIGKADLPIGLHKILLTHCYQEQLDRPTIFKFHWADLSTLYVWRVMYD